MNAQTEVDRISGAVSAAFAALTQKGVTIPSGTKVDGLAGLIEDIETGGTMLPTLTNPGTTADLMAGKQLIDGEGNVVDGAFTLEEEVSAQDSLIAQIKTALKGKAAGGGVALPDLTNPGTAADLMEGKELIDGSGNIVEGSFTLDEEMTQQDSLISQIRAALQGKAAGGSGLPTQEKTVDITENGTHEIFPDDGYTLSKVGVNVNVPIPDGYIKPSGTLEVAENGTHDVTDYESVSVDVPIPDGYIQPSGTMNITENGQYDVTDKTVVDVNIPAGSVDEGTNTQWFADLLTSGSQLIEVYNDKASGTLEPYAFYYNTNVSKIELPNISYLKERSFYYCTSLKTLLLPGLIGYTYQYMADGCTNLETVDIHNASYISSYSFRNCSKLTKLDLHKAENISTYSFYGCTKLETLILRMDAVPTLGGTNAFTNTKIANGTGYIYVPAALVDSYKAASNWSTYADQFRAIEDYPDICG